MWAAVRVQLTELTSLPVSSKQVYKPDLPRKQKGLKKKGKQVKQGTRDCLAEKAMAPHSNTLAWKIPWTEEPGGLQSMGSHRVGQD